MPAEVGRYYEPFVGGGALFFALQPPAATLSDKNPDLIACYKTLRNHPVEVATYLRAWPHDSATYYKIRSQRPTTPSEQAARFIYLTTLAFNGIYRVNRRGEFNVPFSGRAYPWLSDTATLRRYSRALRGVRLECADFAEVLVKAEPGDFVYLDPPYTVAHSANGFLKYNARLFSWADQVRLHDQALSLGRRGCRVVVSSAHHDSVVTLFREFDVVDVERHSTIAASSEARRPIKECVFVYGC
jgi:DNA adenine methylase